MIPTAETVLDILHAPPRCSWGNQGLICSKDQIMFTKKDQFKIVAVPRSINAPPTGALFPRNSVFTKEFTGTMVSATLLPRRKAICTSVDFSKNEWNEHKDVSWAFFFWSRWTSMGYVSQRSKNTVLYMSTTARQYVRWLDDEITWTQYRSLFYFLL